MTYDSPYFGWTVPYEWQEPDYDEYSNDDFDQDYSDLEDDSPFIPVI